MWTTWLILAWVGFLQLACADEEAPTSTGEIVVVHYDMEIVGRAALADIFVSVISADGLNACADVPIPHSSVGLR